MPKAKTIQTNFSAGELSPQAYGRVDIARYGNAAAKLENIISRTLGGAQKRPGWEYLYETKDSADRARLVPFVVTRDKAYMMEFGDQYIRFFKTDGTPILVGGIPYEIATPYDIDKVQEFDFCQSEEAMFVFHQGVQIYRIRSFSETYWDCSAAPFTTIPFAEVGDYLDVALTLNDNTVGTGRTMTAGSNTFLAADVGRAILWEAGVFVITAITATVATGEVKIPFSSTTLPAGEWNLDSSPQAQNDPTGTDTTALGTTLTMTLNKAGWRSTDVGKYVRINGGLIQIATYTSTTVVSGPLKIKMTSGVEAGPLAWTLESAIWTDKFGYPSTGVTHQQRLVVGGTKRNPQTVHGSRSGELLDFMLGTADNEAYSFTIDTSNNKVGPINNILSLRDLIALTDGGEFSLRSGVEKPVTPTNVRINSESGRGSNGVRPVIVGKEALFTQRTGKKLRAISYGFDTDGYNAPDITTLGEHLTQAGIIAMTFQQEPDPIVWIALRTGGFISVTLDRDLDIIAWNRHKTIGSIESMATIPAGDTEQVWAIIRRKLGDGTVKRYIERQQPDWFPMYGTTAPDEEATPAVDIEDVPFNWGFTLDCAMTQDDAAGKKIWDGLDHLEGMDVRCVADGVDMGEFTVTDGTITLNRNAKRVLVGLFYQPIVQPLRPEIATGEGTSQASAMSTNEVTLRFNNTIGATMNGTEVIPGRVVGPDQLDREPVLFSGDKTETNLGWDDGKSEIIVSQVAPFPFYLLAIIRSITVNSG